MPNCGLKGAIDFTLLCMKHCSIIDVTVHVVYELIMVFQVASRLTSPFARNVCQHFYINVIIVKYLSH